jgi:thioredoxin reductase
MSSFITGSRIAVPETGFPTETPFEVQLTNGTTLPSKYDFVILATGQTPNTELLNSLSPSTSTSSHSSPSAQPEESLLNPDNGFIRIRPTLQFQDKAYPHLFAVGDIADTGLRKAARPGAVQAGVAARNINALIRGEDRDRPLEEFPRQPAGIHLSLGLVCAFFPLGYPISHLWSLANEGRNTTSSSGTRMTRRDRRSRRLSSGMSMSPFPI